MAMLTGCRLLAPIGVFLLLCGGIAEAQDGEQRSPYLLVASVLNIHKMYPNGSGLRVIVNDSGISAVAYHYRLEYIFWTTTIERSIKRAWLNGSNVTTMVSEGIESLVDLAVDWINEKLYWTDADLYRIEEVDIVTLTRRVVVQLDTTSGPRGLAIYPLQNYGLLYWMDNIKHSLERIHTTGTSHVILYTGLTCTWPLTLDYQQQRIYWTDYCQYSVESLYINGTNNEVIVRGDDNLVFFPYGITQFEDVIYWTQPMGVYSIMKNGSHVTQIYEGPSNEIIRDIQVVHPQSHPAHLSGIDVSTSTTTIISTSGDSTEPGSTSTHVLTPTTASANATISSRSDSTKRGTALAPSSSVVNDLAGHTLNLSIIMGVVAGVVAVGLLVIMILVIIVVQSAVRVRKQNLVQKSTADHDHEELFYDYVTVPPQPPKETIELRANEAYGNILSGTSHYQPQVSKPPVALQPNLAYAVMQTRQELRDQTDTQQSQHYEIPLAL